MTVETNDTVERYTISGIGPYAFSFRIFDDTDLTVSAIDSDLVTTGLTLSSHYSVTGANDEDGGAITLTADAASTYAGDTLDIRSNTVEYQPTSIRNQGRFLPEIHEDAFDRMVRQVQDLSRKVRSSLRYPDDGITDGVAPSVASRKGRYLFGNAVTGLFEWVTSIATTALSQSIFNQYQADSDPYKRTAAEIAAGVTPTNYFVGELDSAKRYGAFGDAITEDHQAIQREINVAQQYADGADLDLGRGRYMLGSGLTITGSRIHLRGRGKYATQLIYAPSANGTALNIANGASRIDQGSIRDLSILSTDTTYEKVAIALRSVGGYVIERVLVSGSGVDKWNGGASGSTCLKINGRDTSGLSNLELFGQRPIVIGTDPNEPSISIDHFNFHNLYMIAVGAFPTVEIQTGVNLTQVSFTGHQAWVGGNNGLQWIDTTTSAVSNGLLLENVRFESTTDVTKYMVRIEHNTRLGGLTIRGGQGGDRNGFYLRKIDNVHLEDFWFNTTLEALNADATVRKITGINCNWFAGSTKTLAGQRLMLGSPTNPNTGALPPTFIYDESANADDLFNIGRTTTFTVTRNSFTEVLGGGTITSTGSYSKIGKRVEFAIRVVCAGGATIASVANTSFFGGLPPGTFDGVCQVSRYDNTTSLGNGWVQASGANVLTPVWGAAANATYLISGSYEIA